MRETAWICLTFLLRNVTTKKGRCVDNAIFEIVSLISKILCICILCECGVSGRHGEISKLLKL